VADGWKRALPALVGGLPVVALALAWAADDGGYAPVAWYPGGLLLLGLLAAALIGLGPRRRRLTRPAAVALAALAAYTAWSYLSIAWAGAPGDAFEGANRTLVFLLAFALMAILPWEPGSAFAALATYAIGVAVLAGLTIARITATDDPSPYFIDARLAEPLGYQNANAALWTFGGLVALMLAARRQTPLALRPVLLAGAGLTFQTALLCQSRGWLYGLPVVFLVLLAVTGQRLRLVAFTVPVAAAVVAASGPLLRVFDVGGYRDGDTRSLDQAVADIARALGDIGGPIVLTTGLLFLAGVALALLDDRLRPSPGVVRGANRLAAAAAVALAVAGVAGVVVATDGNPVDRVERAWEEFRTYEEVPGQSGARLASFSSGRYDFWRVALDAVGERPVGGLGQDNFLRTYLAERRMGEEPRWVHSLPLRLLAHTGIVGFLLFGVFGVAALLAAWRARGLLRVRGGRVLLAAAAAPFLVWVVQGSIDWLWEYPSLSVPALGLLAMAGAVRETTGEGDVAWASPRPRVPRSVLAGLGVAGALLAVAVLTPPWLAAREQAGAVDEWREGRRDQAFDRLDRAARLDPLSADPLITEALLALRAGDRVRAREAFIAADRREADNWFIDFQLGLMASEAGDAAAARRRFGRARSRKAGDPVIAEAIRRAGTDEPMTLAEGDRLLVERSRERTAR
jgi:hypothetical protein